MMRSMKDNYVEDERKWVLSELALYCLPLIVLLEETLTGEGSA